MTLHTIPPLYDEKSKILILGSFPSVKSREEGFFYGHPQNRFWKMLSKVFDMPIPQDKDEKCKLLLSNNLALWDVIGSCEIVGSSDSSIKNAVPNDLSAILDTAKIEKIILNGKTAERYFNKYLRSTVSVAAVCLPSTSPANAAWSLDDLVYVWGSALKNKAGLLHRG